jgi:hypothetical protein
MMPTLINVVCVLKGGDKGSGITEGVIWKNSVNDRVLVGTESRTTVRRVDSADEAVH